MRMNLWATGAFLLFPCIPLACSAAGDTDSGPDSLHKGGRSGAGGSSGTTGYGGIGGAVGSGQGGSGQGGSGQGGSGQGGSGQGGSGQGGSGGLGGSGGMGGDGGMGATGGIGAGGTGDVGGTGPGGTGGSGANTGKDPVIPPVAGECPTNWNSTITLMGLGGIRLVSGTKPSSPTAPMVFYWHGTGGSSGEYASMAAAVAQGVQQEGGVLVSFQGTLGGDLTSGTNIFGLKDLPVADQLVACAVRDRNVDPHRIHATGCSAGGLFTDAMGIARSQYMASVASNSGGLVQTPTWGGANTPGLMTIHGGASDMVIVTFSQTSATADKTYKQHGGFVINCDHGGGHCGGAGFAGDIWKFFKAHPYGVVPAPSPWTGGLPAGFSTQCKIFTG